MADIPPITCPSCAKKFKSKADLRGKRIRCPFCSESFIVPLDMLEEVDEADAGEAEAGQADAGQADAGEGYAVEGKPKPQDDDLVPADAPIPLTTTPAD